MTGPQPYFSERRSGVLSTFIKRLEPAQRDRRALEHVATKLSESNAVPKD